MLSAILLFFVTVYCGKFVVKNHIVRHSLCINKSNVVRNKKYCYWIWYAFSDEVIRNTGTFMQQSSADLESQVFQRSKSRVFQCNSHVNINIWMSVILQCSHYIFSPFSFLIDIFIEYFTFSSDFSNGYILNMKCARNSAFGSGSQLNCCQMQYYSGLDASNIFSYIAKLYVNSDMI